MKNLILISLAVSVLYFTNTNNFCTAQIEATIEQKIETAIQRGSFDFRELGKNTPTSMIPRIRAHLKDQSFEVRQNSFNILANIPSEATSVILEGLSSGDEALRSAAIYLAIDKAKDRRIQDKWIQAVTTPTKMSSGGVGEIVNEFLWKLPSVVRESVVSRMIPKVLENLKDYDSYGTCSLVNFLGRYAEPGDKTVLRSLADLRNDIRGANKRKWEVFAQGQLGPERAEEAILFAEANLGDATSLTRFSYDLISGPTEVRKSRILLLKRFRPTRPVVEMAYKALDDTTNVLNYAIPNRYYTEVNYYRVCDLTVDALAGWFPDFIYPKPPRRAAYKDEEIRKKCLFAILCG